MDIATQIEQQLREAGIPVDLVSYDSDDGAGLRIQYGAEATPEQRAQGRAIADEVLAGE